MTTSSLSQVYRAFKFSLRLISSTYWNTSWARPALGPAAASSTPDRYQCREAGPSRLRHVSGCACGRVASREGKLEVGPEFWTTG
jgi:hypothetical protein